MKRDSAPRNFDPTMNASGPSLKVPRLATALGIMLGTLVSAPVLAAGADVSADEIYSDDVTLRTWDGDPLDLNGDGETDLAIASNRNGPTDRSRYYLGNGDGTFDPAFIGLEEGVSSQVVAADFNGDTFLDLLQGRRDDTALLYFGDGAGNVGAATPASADTTRVLSIAVGDLDLDGDLDFVTGNGQQGGIQTNPLQPNRYYLNDGSGAFTGADISADADDTRGIELADIDGDGLLDVIAASDETTPGSNQIYLNTTAMGAVSFAAGVGFGPADDQTSSVLVGDLDNDGDPDIVTLNTTQAGFSPGVNRFFLNASTSGVVDVGAGEDVSADTDRTNGGTLADFDGDGDLDLAVANGLPDDPVTQSARNRLYLNQFVESGSVSFSAAADVSDDEQQSRELDAADLDGDGDIDIVVGNQDNVVGVSGRDRVYLNNGTATPFTNVAPSFTSTAVTDAAVDEPYSYDVTVSEADGDPVTITAPTLPAWLSLTDNGDGTATLTGTPADTDAGDHDVSLEASDGTLSSTQDFTITVAAEPPVNTAPSFTSTPVTDATEAAAYTYDVTATDADSGDTLVISAPTLPAWLTLTDNGDGTATLAGTPGSADVGDHAVSLEVSDGTDTATQDFTIAVAGAGPTSFPPPGYGTRGGGGSTGLFTVLGLLALAAFRRRA